MQDKPNSHDASWPATESAREIDLSAEQLALLTELAKKGRLYAGPLTPDLHMMQDAGLVASTIVNDIEFVVGITERGRGVLEEANALEGHDSLADAVRAT
jgi:hypothetical protein